MAQDDKGYHTLTPSRLLEIGRISTPAVLPAHLKKKLLLSLKIMEPKFLSIPGLVVFICPLATPYKDFACNPDSVPGLVRMKMLQGAQAEPGAHN